MVVEKKLKGNFLSPIPLEMSKINLLGILRVLVALILIVIEVSYGMNWLVYLVGGTCPGAFGAGGDLREIRWSPFMSSDGGVLKFHFSVGLMDIPLVEGPFTWSNSKDPPS
jgi:hypothetical protein